VSVSAQYTPHRLRDGGWDDAGRADAIGDRVVAVIEDLAPGFASSIRAREVITPLDLERDYGLTGGHPLHGEQALDQFFLWRPFLGSGRYRLPIDGLYLCASGAHPGGGITGQPGQNAAREVLADLKRRR
jgi:phytoene dehydrogenase-like protein